MKNSLFNYMVGAILLCSAATLSAQNAPEKPATTPAKPDRTTNGKGRVASFALEETRKLDAGGWFDEKYNGTKVPLLEEVFDLVGKDKLINIELTNYSSPRDGLTVKVCELIKRHNNHSQILFSSFLSSNLKIAAQALPEIPYFILSCKTQY